MGELKKKEKGEILKEIIHKEIVEKEVALSWDGRNLVVRFPKDIANYLGVNKKNRFEKKLKFIVEEGDKGEMKKSFEIVDRKDGKKKSKK